MSHVLIVDDERAFAQMIADSLSAVGFETAIAATRAEAVKKVSVETGLVFLDLRMEGNEQAGLEILTEMRGLFPSLPVVMITAYGDVQAAVSAMKNGALDFIEKPVDIADIRRIATHVLRAEEPSQNSEDPIPFGGIVPGEGPMRTAVGLLLAAAGSEAPVLITGESGTGKELAAVFVHERSFRRKGPLVKVNCSAIPRELVESEMFGSVEGAFTGAKARSGRFAAAEGGTIFLDEIAEMDSGLQVKLLRVLQEKEYEPVGAVKPKKADVRVVAATNRPLRESIEKGILREDLYFRLNVFQITIPPLRERRADILPLARYLLSQAVDERPRKLSSEVETVLLNHAWPGNVRELANAIERARILARGGVIRPEHLPPTVAVSPSIAPVLAAPPAGTSINDMEHQLIVRTLEQTNGNRTEAAKRLGISRRALLYKIKRYGIEE